MTSIHLFLIFIPHGDGEKQPGSLSNSTDQTLSLTLVSQLVARGVILERRVSFDPRASTTGGSLLPGDHSRL